MNEMLVEHHTSTGSGLEADLRSDHAGEYGAVAIYEGILATARWSDLREFASAHLETETKHLALMEKLVPASKRSRLLPLWRTSGWLLGAIPAALSKEATFATIVAIEQYVERHYKRQIHRLGNDEASIELRRLLADCCRDEVAHKEDAQLRLQCPSGPLERLWSSAVAAGSALAVGLARRL